MPVPLRPAFLMCSLVVVAAATARADTLEFQDGHRVQGRLVSVSRGWVEFQPLEGDDAAEQMRVALAEVRAIRFDDDDDAPAVAPEAAGGGDRIDRSDAGPRMRQRRSGDEAGRRSRRITVSTGRRWTDTGIDITTGEVVSFSTAGKVTLGDDRPLGPEGDLDGAIGAPGRPMPDQAAGALIGRIGTSPDDTFLIGGQRLPFRVRTSGRLYLGINVSDQTLADDEGAFQVAVSR